jgi:hypothetical protein
MDKLTMSDVFHTGKRLLLARNLKSLTAKDIANEFNVLENTALKWQKRGVPDRSVPALANYFGVDEWVFTHQGITEEEFKNLILNPNRRSSIRPVFSFQGKLRQKDGLIRTNSFNITVNKILTRAFIWSVEGQTISQFSLTREGYNKMRTIERQQYPEPKTLRLITDKSTKISDRVMGEMIVEHLKPQTYYFTIHTPKHFELFVFELEQYAA